MEAALALELTRASALPVTALLDGPESLSKQLQELRAISGVRVGRRRSLGYYREPQTPSGTRRVV
jgi:hypothetical protein